MCTVGVVLVLVSFRSKNVNSLVGVAISASLLPPAVNTGLCLSFALLAPSYVGFEVDVSLFIFLVTQAGQIMCLLQ